MQSNIIQRLFASFTDLEQAISGARQTLAEKGGVPTEVIQRLQSYDGILLKQRNLAQSLQEHMTQGNWDEVARHVSLINGLSAMIRDDARAILSTLALNTDKAQVDDSSHVC